MKMAKKFKIISILTTFALVMLALFALFGSTKVASVSAAPVPNSYFSYDSDRVADENAISFENDNVVIKLKNGESVNFVNQLVVDDFEIVLEVPAGVNKLTLTASSNSFDPNGNKNSLEGFDKTIDNVVLIDIANGTAKLNEGPTVPVTYTKNATNGVELTIGLSESIYSDNLLSATVQGETVAQPITDYYKVAGADKMVANIKLSILDADITSDYKIDLKSVSQKTGDDNYTQTFELNEAKTGFRYSAWPRVSVADKFFSEGSTASQIKVLKGMFYSLTYTPYSFLGNHKVSDLQHTSDNVNVAVNKNSSSNICFTGSAGSEAVFSVGSDSVKYETYTVRVVSDNVAPVYVYNEDAIDAFNNEIKDKLYIEHEDGTKSYVRLGSNQYLELPSFKCLVSDDVTSYDNLKYTVYYITPSSTSASTTSSLKVQIAEAGTYWFYVVFSDQTGNEMDKDAFKIDIDNESNNGDYAKYIFSFSIDDDYPINVTAATKYDNGYKGINYTASAFNIDASGSGYTANYELLYKVGDGEDDWITIPKSSQVDSLTDNQFLVFKNQGFTKDELKEIDYDGNLTFTPTRLGTYKITCLVTSTVSSQRTEDIAETAEIKIDKEMVEVTPASTWFEDNLWSIIFLSVGTLCLIGIIALLVIKPKEKNDKE